MHSIVNNLVTEHARNVNRPRSLALHLYKLTEAVEGIERLAVARNPMETDAAHARRVAAAAHKVKAQAEMTRSQIKESGSRYRDEITNEINQKCRLGVSSGSEEYRQILRGMDTKSRALAVIEALDQNNTAFLAAVFSGDKFLTGIDNDFRESVKKDYLNRSSPDLLRELDGVNSFLQHSDMLISQADEAVQSAYDPAYIEQIQNMESKALETQAEFEMLVRQ